MKIENLQEQKIIIKNLQTNYKIIGDGKPMLVLHGWPSSSDKWQKVAEILEQKNIKVIIPDLPGFGKSQQPQKPWSLDDYVEWVKEFSEKLPDLNNDFYLLGHSFGGALSAKFSIKYSQKVKKLFLVSAACVRTNTKIKKVFYRIAKVIKFFSFLPYYQKFRKAIYKFIIKKSDYLNQEGVMKETYLKVILDDLSCKVSFIKVPTVIIWGDSDQLTPLSQAKLIKNRISNSKLVIIKGADHALQIKIPEILSEKIIENI